VGVVFDHEEVFFHRTVGDFMMGIVGIGGQPCVSRKGRRRVKLLPPPGRGW
jgi:hypothetical protein